MPGYIYYAEPLNNPQSEEKGSALDLWELPEEERIHFQMHPQQGEDLGERLYNAALEILTKYEAVLILGSDMPEITPDIILEAQERLFSSEIVIGPAHDGGYYLLGVKQAYPNIFCNIPWGTPQVLEKTLEIIRQNNLTFSLLQTHADIDNWDDLVNFFRIGKADENNRYESLAAFQIAVKLVEKYREGVRGWINT